MTTTIKEVRGNLDLTQRQMALCLGMTQPMIGKIEGNVENRKETKGHITHLVAIKLIFEHGLLEDLMSKLKE